MIVKDVKIFLARNIYLYNKKYLSQSTHEIKKITNKICPFRGVEGEGDHSIASDTEIYLSHYVFQVAKKKKKDKMMIYNKSITVLE